MASEYEAAQVSPADFIQEGNIALLMALEALEPMESLAAYQARLMNEIAAGLREAAQVFDSQGWEKQTAGDKISRLREAAGQLEEDLGHAPDAEELAAFLEIPVSQVRDILALFSST